MSEIRWQNGNTLVIYTDHEEDFLSFFRELGLTFKKEQHGFGPEHHACQVGDKVLEVYPPPKFARLRCLLCGNFADWIRHTQFEGEHSLCAGCAETEEDFGENDDSTRWEQLSQ